MKSPAATAALSFVLLAIPARAQKPELVVEAGHTGWVNSVAFSPDGRIVASGSQDNTIKLWDVATGRELRTLAGQAADEVSSVAFSSDGRTLASGSRMNSAIELWDVASGRETRIAGHTTPYVFGILTYGSETRVIETTGNVNSVAFSPDGRTLASGSSDRTIKLWDIASRRELRTLAGHTNDVTSIAFSPDGRTVSSGSHDCTIKLWDVASGRELRTLATLPGIVYSIAFSPDGRTLASGSYYNATKPDNTIKLWDVASGQALPGPAEHVEIMSVAFSPDGRTLAFVSGSQIKLWDVANGRELRTVSGHTGSVMSVAFSPDSSNLVSGSLDGTIKFWDVASGRELRTAAAGHTDWVNSVAFSPDGRTLALGSSDKTIKVWDVTSGRERLILAGHTGPVSSIAFSPDGSILASGSIDKRIKLWDVASGRELRTVADGHTDRVNSIAFSPDGHTLASGSGDKTIKLWDVASGHELRTLTNTTGVAPKLGDALSIESIAFSPDGRTLASGSIDHRIKLWDVASGRELRILAGHTDRVESVAFSPDGRTLASGSDDKMTKLWNLAKGRELHTVTAHTNWVRSVAFSPNGRFTVSGGSDGSVEIWDAASGEHVATLVSMSGSPDWLIVTADGLFDGSADAMQQVAWRRVPNTNDTVSLDFFYNDFFHPGLLAEIFESKHPQAPYDIATAVQVPGLRSMLAEKLAHIEDRNGQPVVCFDEKPGAVVNVSPADQRVFFPPVKGYGPGGTPTCKFEKALSASHTNSAALTQQLQAWKPEVITTPWDGKPSDTGHSTLHLLTVGISQYSTDSGFDRLPYAAPSAKGIEGFFREQQASAKNPYAAVRVWDGLYDSEATRRKIRQRLEEMAKEVGEDDVVLLYLAGHGKVSLGQEMFYFVPMDGRDDNLPETAVSTAVLAEAIRNMPARRIVLILDACQSGGAIEALNKIGAIKAQVEQRRAQQQTKAPRPQQGVGVHLIAATLPLSYAVGLNRSVLAETLLQALQQEAGQVTANQLCLYVRDRLPAISEQVMHGFRQVPLTNSIGLDFAISADRNEQLENPNR